MNSPMSHVNPLLISSKVDVNPLYNCFWVSITLHLSYEFKPLAFSTIARKVKVDAIRLVTTAVLNTRPLTWQGVWRFHRSHGDWY
jgi:hypothetical protein